MVSIPYTQEMQEAFDDEAPEEFGFKLILSGPWTNDGKYEHKEDIYQRIEDDKLFAYFGSRSGSYHSDYYYEEPSELVEVEPVETIKIEYKVVK